MQRSPAVGHDWGAAVPNALQKGPAHQEVHQDCCSVSHFSQKKKKKDLPIACAVMEALIWLRIQRPLVANH